MKEPPDKFSKYENYLTSYTTVKTSYESIVKYDYILEITNKVVNNVHKIVIHTYNFLKLYSIHTYETTGQLPIIDENLIKMIMKTIAIKDNRGSKPTEKNKNIIISLQLFHEKYYRPIMYEQEDLTITNLNTLLDYEAKNMITVIENHIKNNFFDFFGRYINIMVNKENQEKKIRSDKNLSKEKIKTKISLFRKEIRKLKMDLLKNKNECNGKYNILKRNIRENLFSNNLNEIMKQVNNDPIIFLLILIKMSVEIENKGEKFFNCFPLRKNIIPKYVKLDTTTIIHLFFTPDMNKSFYLNDGNTILFKDYIWDMFFRTERKFFNKKNYVFENQICTDGIACSILLLRKDLYKPDKKHKIQHVHKPFDYKSEMYIDEMTDEEKIKFKDYSKVGVDPGKDDLIYASTIKNENEGYFDIVKFRYSQCQRKKETKSKKYMKILDKDKKETIILNNDIIREFKNCKTFEDIEKLFSKKMNIIVKDKKSYMDQVKNCKTIEEFGKILNNKNKIKKEIKGCTTFKNISEVFDNRVYNNNNISVKELETVLSSHNSKSCKYDNVEAYIKIKNKTNSLLYKYYEKTVYRKLKWNAKINKQRSEAKMINNFKNIFGDPSKVLIGIGDFEQKRQMKYKEPTKGKSFRKLFRKAGYNLFLVNEYNTSKMNFFTELENEKFRKRRNPRPWKDNIITVHGLLRSKSGNDGKSTGHILLNRDTNGSLNIRKKMICIISNNPLPPCLTRQ